MWAIQPELTCPPLLGCTLCHWCACGLALIPLPTWAGHAARVWFNLKQAETWCTPAPLCVWGTGATSSARVVSTCYGQRRHLVSPPSSHTWNMGHQAWVTKKYDISAVRCLRFGLMLCFMCRLCRGRVNFICVCTISVNVQMGGATSLVYVRMHIFVWWVWNIFLCRPASASCMHR